MNDDTPTNPGGLVTDDDDEKLFAELATSADNQIVLLGLLVAAIMLFGSIVWGWAFGDDAPDDVRAAPISRATDERCRAVLESLEDSSLEADAYSGVRCSIDGGRVVLTGRVDSEFDRTAVRLAAGAAGFAGTALLPDADDIVVRSNDDRSDDIAASDDSEARDVDEGEGVEADTSTTTSAAPTTTEATTSTAAPETTTTAAPTTTEAPAASTLADALAAGGATRFTEVADLLGVDLAATEDADGNELRRTLFAPSDAAFDAFGEDELAVLAADPEAARALLNYHIVDGTVSADDLPTLVGQTVPTLNGLPLTFTMVDDQVVLNGVSVVETADLPADNGVVHVIDRLLVPPTVNEIVGLENIEFEVNSATITPAGQAELQKAITFFTENATLRAAIEGHTDTDGNDADNLDLSQRRAEAVKQFLVDNGVDGERLTTQGFGETRPILVDGAEDKAASRRIEFNVR